MMTGASARATAVLVVIGLTHVVAACTDATTAPPPVRPVLSIVADVRTTDTIGPFAGTIEPRYTVALGFQVFGRLIARDVNVGDVVTKGQQLAAIDPAAQTISVRSAQASLNSAEAQLATATAAEERERTLLEQRVIAPSQFELIQQNRETAAANAPRPRTSSRRRRTSSVIPSSIRPWTESSPRAAPRSARSSLPGRPSSRSPVPT
jgi:multidrug efflux pump subunit AcrA (membrane-fusion protein)